MSDERADVVVVGAGHNGLVAAAYLAGAGLDVVVCERRPVVGGATVTEELAEGFRVSSASYSLSLLRPDVYADLQLARHGLEILPKDPQLFCPQPDGSWFFVWRDAARTREELERIHRPDADGYVRWSAFWDEATPKLRRLIEDPEPRTLAEVERALGADLYRACVAGSAADLVARFFEAPPVQGAFASQGIVGTRAGVRDPGTAWVLAYHALGGELVGADGTWAYVRGGMGSVSRAIAAAATARGARILVDAAVDEVVVEGGSVAGVRLVDGRVVRASTVVSNADPVTTFGRLVPDGHLDAAFRDRVRAWPTPGSVVKVNLALDALPDFSCLPGRGPQQRGTIEIAPSLDHLQRAFDDASGVDVSAEPWMEVFVQSAVDDSLAPPGRHVLSAFAQYAPADLTAWDPAAARDAVVSTLAAYAPNVPGAILHEEILGPPELEARFGLAGGNIFHGELLPETCFAGRFDHAAPLPGLYLCGSGARPGGCVMGAAGRNAATAVLSRRTAAPG